MNVALIFAGGSGSRMGDTKKPKQFLEIYGKAIIIHSILNFEKHEDIDSIAVVCVEEWQEYFRGLLTKEGIKKVKWIVSGGLTGQQSIYNGVKAIYEDSKNPSEVIVLVSDGVRPHVSKEIISKNIACTIKNGTSATSTFATETIIEIDENNKVVKIPDRKTCMLSKAPQGFILEQLMEVHKKAIKDNKFDCTNSIELMKYYGYDIYVVEGTANNIKITTPFDINLYKTILDHE